jgi:hypothetical protein
MYYAAVCLVTYLSDLGPIPQIHQSSICFFFSKIRIQSFQLEDGLDLDPLDGFLLKFYIRISHFSFFHGKIDPIFRRYPLPEESKIQNPKSRTQRNTNIKNIKNEQTVTPFLTRFHQFVFNDSMIGQSKNFSSLKLFFPR